MKLKKQDATKVEAYSILQPALYGITKGSIYYGIEPKGGLGSIKLALTGSRKVILIAYDDVLSFMNDDVAATDVPHGKIVRDFTMRKDSLKDCAQKYKAYVCTQGPGDILITPACFVQFEEVHEDDDVYGIKMSYISKPCVPLLQQHLLAFGGNVAIQGLLQ